MLAELAGQLLRLRLVAVDNLDLVSTRHGAGLDPFRSAHPALPAVTGFPSMKTRSQRTQVGWTSTANEV
jgi:hypothetical protein